MTSSSSLRVPASAEGEGRYVDAALLERVEAFLQRCIQRDQPADCTAEELYRIEQFAFHEAALLDRRRYLEWFDLLDHDVVYWIPSAAEHASTRSQVAVNLDDRRRLLDRIAYTRSGVQWAQVPVSRTARSITNLRAWRSADGSFEASASLVVRAHRRGVTSCFAGHQHLLLRPHGGSFRIAMRILELLDCDEPQGNNSFIL